MTDTPTRRVQKFFDPAEKRTKQSEAPACDINVLVRQHIQKGELPPPTGQELYGDFSTVDDFLGAQLRVAQAEEAFDRLPSRVRSRFRNDPAELIAFARDPENLQEAIELGLVDKPETPPETPPPGDPVVPQGGE